MISHPESKTTLADMFDDSINYEKHPGITDGLGLVSVWSDQMVLDFGCGAARNRRRIEKKGGKWVGIDIEGSSVSVKCDGHMLPFQDSTFDIVTAEAVFEHLHNPFHAISEVSRVCKPGGLFVGYVAFLEPFHMSYFHHSHKGIEYLLKSNGFEVTDILPSRPGIEKQFEDLIFPRKIKLVTLIISRGIRTFLFLCKKLLYLVASVSLFLRGEPRSIRRKRLVHFRTLLEVGYAGGLLFKGVKLRG